MPSHAVHEKKSMRLIKGSSASANPHKAHSSGCKLVDGARGPVDGGDTDTGADWLGPQRDWRVAKLVRLCMRNRNIYFGGVSGVPFLYIQFRSFNNHMCRERVPLLEQTMKRRFAVA
jgi:hypothetical protein